MEQSHRGYNVDRNRQPEWLKRILADAGSSTIIFFCEPSTTEDGEVKYVTLLPICFPCSDLTPNNMDSSSDSPVTERVQPTALSKADLSRIPCICSLRPSPQSSINNYKWSPPKTSAPLNGGELPVELWDRIVKNLKLADVKNLRLVSKGLEQNVSARLFNTIVVPFTAELHRGSDPTQSDKSSKETDDSSRLATERGIHMFSSFGRHIRNFGISFVCDEAVLRHPPSKDQYETINVWWGSYPWPLADYARFIHANKLEIAADEIEKMRTAYSYLTGVTHLALSVDAGFGWLSGPDVPVKSKLLGSRSPVFDSHFQLDQTETPQRELWNFLKKYYDTTGRQEILQTISLECTKVDATFLYPCITSRPFNQLPTSRVEPLLLSNATAGVDDDDNESRVPNARSRSMKGNLPGEKFKTDTGAQSSQKMLLYTKPYAQVSDFKPALVPRELSTRQKEWLMELAWAQDAFLLSYTLSVADQPSVFGNVQQLSIAEISSRHLGQLCRKEFWTSLSSLTSVSIQVIADFRDVKKSSTGDVEAPPIRPYAAVRKFYDLLEQFILQKPSISKLHVAWINGGEHAEGRFARNRQILPAPVALCFDSHYRGIDVVGEMLQMPFIEEFTLSNCWVSPYLMEQLCNPSNTPNLKTLALESVSITEEFRNAPQQYGSLDPESAAPPPTQLQTYLLSAGLTDRLSHVNEPSHMLYWLLDYLTRDMRYSVARVRDFWNQAPAGDETQEPIRNSKGSWPEVLKRLDLVCQARCTPLSLICRSIGHVRLPWYLVRQDRTIMGEAEHFIDNPPLYHHGAIRPYDIQHDGLSQFMLIDKDIFHGTVGYALTTADMQVLREHWGLYEGWPELGDSLSDLAWSYGTDKWGEDGREQCLLDGVDPGRARFSGVVSELGNVSGASAGTA